MGITPKGHLTVPKRLRDRFAITPDTDLEFREERGKLVLGKAGPEVAIRSIRRTAKRLPFGKDVDDYLRTTRGSR